jgi:hypothetical protein
VANRSLDGNAATGPGRGTFLQIPLPDGSFGYGRTLERPFLAFYDYRTTEPSSDLDTIASKPVLFRQAVETSYLKKWKQIGRADLSGAVTRPVVRFSQDFLDYRNCIIFDGTGARRKASPEECVGLEQLAIWEPHHIEQRLLDKFMGRPNATEEAMKVKLGDDEPAQN